MRWENEQLDLLIVLRVPSPLSSSYRTCPSGAIQYPLLCAIMNPLLLYPVTSFCLCLLLLSQFLTALALNLIPYPSFQIFLQTPIRLNNHLLLLSTSKNMQSWPQKSSPTSWKENRFPKSSISTACCSPWKVYLDIDSVITYA